jgi:transcriptional regulator with XRE-family HTH domain
MKGVQLRMARAALRLTVREAARASGVSHDTVVRIEADQALKDSTVRKVRAALEAAGVIFLDDNGEGPGVKLRRKPAS